MKHANYARTRATKAKGGQTTFLTRWGLTAPLEFHKPINSHRQSMKKMYKITLCSLWNKENFIIEGLNEQDALCNLVNYLVNNNIGEGQYWEELESLDCEYSKDEIEDMGFVYIDATRNGANRPVYLMEPGMEIEQTELPII